MKIKYIISLKYQISTTKWFLETETNNLFIRIINCSYTSMYNQKTATLEFTVKSYYSDTIGYSNSMVMHPRCIW